MLFRSLEFDDAGRIKPSAYYERVVDVMEELVKFTLLTRDASPYLVDRYSERGGIVDTGESALDITQPISQAKAPPSDDAARALRRAAY